MPPIEQCEVFDRAPALTTIRDAVYFPNWFCLYDLAGNRIPETRRVRGRGSGFRERDGPAHVEVPKEIPIFDHPVLYLQHPKLAHWGHFLTEGISRLWALKQYPELTRLPAIHHQGQLNEAQELRFSAMLAAAGIDTANFFSPSQPIRLREVIVPEPTFINRDRALRAHAMIPEAMAETVCRQRYSLSNQPIYLSRRQLPNNRRKVTGEELIEAALDSSGFRIVAPETLSFDEQIVLFNSHKTFVGCIGSAFHGLLFCLSPVRTVVLTGEQINPNYLMIDTIKGVDSHYVRCITASGELDIERALSVIADAKIAPCHFRFLAGHESLERSR